MSVAIDVDSFPAKPGLFLSGGRWRILQKLGAGPRSSTWLAVNSEDSNNIAALKILTVRATTTSAELRLLKKIKRAKLYQLPVLRSSFVETSPHGQHLCLLLDLLGPSVEDFREGQPLSVHIVKKIVADVLEALCALHDKGIIHAGNDDAPHPIKPPFSWAKSRTSFANASVHLSNLGYAQEAATATSLDGPSHILPPEALLGAHIGVKADIWMLGCVTYLLLSGKPLFAPSLSVLEHLAQMLTLHDGTTKFSEGILNKFPRTNELFCPSGELKMDVSPAQSLEDCLSATLSTRDVPSAAAFIRACLTLDPEERLDAHALIGHEWVQQGTACDCECQLPHELHEEILSCLSLIDAFSLLLTCTNLYFSRALWFSMLEHASKFNPLPGPFNLDIAAMNLTRLRMLARKARVLQLNMARGRPRYQSRARFDLQKGTDQVIITAIPGTQIILTQTWKASTISCWDLSTETAVSIGTVKDVRLNICSSPYIAHDQFTLAIVSKSHWERIHSRASVVVISVNYSDRSNITFTETFRRQVSLLDPRLHPAMHSPTQGILVGVDNGYPLVATFDTTSQQDPAEIISLKSVPFQISCAIEFIHVYASQDRYYMAMELRNRIVEIIHFPFTEPESILLPESIIRLESIDGDFGYTTLCNTNVAGIQTVSRRSRFLNDTSDDADSDEGRLVDPVQQELTLTFWLIGTSHYSFTFNLNTSRFHSQVIWQSGPSLLLLLYKPVAEGSYEQEHSLELFRFKKYPIPSCTRHQLTVPPDVDLDSLALDGVAGRFEWDDHLGIAYTILKGVITTIAYV